MEILLSFLFAYIFTRLVFPFLVSMLQESELVRPNYQGEKIAVGTGIIFLLGILVTATFGRLFAVFPSIPPVFLLALAIMGFFGFIDDALGSRNASGLRGHFANLRRGKMTTGALKALVGGTIAVYSVSGASGISITDNYFLLVFMDALLVALATNALNLLDLRPGRAIKGYLVFLAVIGMVAFIDNNAVFWYVTPLLGALVVYAPYDFRGKAMMGDTGSNLLGISLGLLAVWIFPPVGRLAALLFLVILHWYTEKYSLTETIEKNVFLNFLDRIGRPND